MRLFVRIILFIIFFLPSIPFIWCVSTLFGLGALTVLIISIYNFVLGYALDDFWRLEMAENSIKFLGKKLAEPFTFWFHFVINSRIIDIWK